MRRKRSWVLALAALSLASVLAGCGNSGHGNALIRVENHETGLTLMIPHGWRAWDGSPITFAEWGYLWKGRFQRRDFSLRSLTQSSAFSAEGELFANLGKHEMFTPTKTYPPMTVSELVAATPEATL